MRAGVATLIMIFTFSLAGMAQDTKQLGRKELKRVQQRLTQSYVPTRVTLRQDLAYGKRTAVITSSSVMIQPISPEDRAEEYYGKAGARFTIRGVHVDNKEVVFTLYPVYVDAKTLPTPPINPNDPPFEPQQAPVPKRKRGIAGVLKPPGPVNLSVVLTYGSADELEISNLETRLKQVFDF